ncbi:MAG: hypothetical protein KR126chlam2_01059, partial [Chlamydiae bacterium]|nr:hypothetical protein [Chlamydiota bacterium]
MKKSIVVITALLLVLVRVNPVLAGGSCAANYTSCSPQPHPSQSSSCQPQSCYTHPENCPSAPVCGTECSLNILSMTLPILLVGGVIAVILS